MRGEDFLLTDSPIVGLGPTRISQTASFHVIQNISSREGGESAGRDGKALNLHLTKILE